MERTGIRAGELADGMSDLELLSAALDEAMDAHSRGLVIGPAVDEMALTRAARRARHRDTARALRTKVGGAA